VGVEVKRNIVNGMLSLSHLLVRSRKENERNGGEISGVEKKERAKLMFFFFFFFVKHLSCFPKLDSSSSVHIY
jgi:hypothetical protein